MTSVIMNDTSTLAKIDPLYQPESQAIARTQLTTFIHYCEQQTGLRFADYADFDVFSKSQYKIFWNLFLDWSQIVCQGDKQPVCAGDDCETAVFFPNLRLNYTENLLRDTDTGNLIGCHADGSTDVLSRADLRLQVTRLAHRLRRLGAEPGDRIAAVARNNIEVIVAALATAAIGAVFSSVAHDMGVTTALARLQQLSPKVLFANCAAQPGDGELRLDTRIQQIVAGLPSLQAVVVLDGTSPGALPVYSFAELVSTGPADFDWPRFDFNHPLFIMFSSGTTGLPKCIVHGAGGTLLEHLKEHRLHGDLRQSDRMLFQTSCGWMMWNWQLSALACGADIVVYDGPLRGPETMWEMVAAQNVTVFGTNPAYIQFVQTVGYTPENLEFAALRSVLSTGSILHPGQFDWIVRHVKRVPVQSISGGTDIIGCFVLGNPNLPVYRGKLQCTSLGLDVRSVPPEAQVGDLVCVNPFPSRPTGIFGDDEGTRYHEAYFTQNPGIWTHGDLIELTEHGAIMHGRSDAVMNIRGVRVGPAEIYRILREIPAIVEAMAVEQLHPAEPGGVRLILLVVLRSEVILDTDLIIQIRTMLADQGHATMVPAAIVQVPELPVTFNSKLSEAAARDAVNNRTIRNRAALRNPDCLTGLWEKIEQSGIDIKAGFDTADMERSLCQLCQRYLRVPVHPSDNFLALGGDSITILSFLLDVADKAPVKVPFPMLIGVSTVGELVRVLCTGTAGVSVAANAPDIRPVEYADEAEVCDLLREGFNANVQWHRIFNHPWQAPDIPRGYVLTVSRRIVGFIGLICVLREIKGQLGLIANLTSWYVRPAYRGWSNALLAAAVEADHITYTSLTPGKSAQRVLPAMGFVPLDRAKRFSPPLNYARRSRNRRVSVTIHPTHLRADLQRILDDHAPYQCLPVLLIDEEEVLIIVHRWLFRRLLPFSEILYCNAPDVLKRHLDMVKSVIMREQKTLGLVFGEHLQCGGIYLPEKTLFRSSHFAAHDLDKIYSELTLLL